ncbi:oxidoreductase [Streptomyces sulfonofaciens]|uniref:Oxidoreductase n=2 Tax=Streptomyces sulfonofaciens TaxID=68272 RepID=A0A919GPS3_9ACTN|nr:oxidoreductase [Streptomyces sulfonofaciens]
MQTSVREVASRMRDKGIGAVLVMEGETLRGMVTDRDIVVRSVADGEDPGHTPVRAVCSERLTTVSPDDPQGRAVGLMRRHAVRRLPVLDEGRPVGIVALGDLAVERDPGSALGEISAAEPNT